MPDKRLVSLQANKDTVVTSALLAMLVRMALPIGAVVLIGQVSRPLMEAGFFGLLTCLADLIDLQCPPVFTPSIMTHPNRRRFLATGFATAAATSLGPNLLLGKDKALNKLNVAAVGCGGKGGSDISQIAPGNHIAALCDVDLKRGKKSGSSPKEEDVFIEQPRHVKRTTTKRT